MKLTILYFAWVRERIGEGREDIDTNASTISELVEDLRNRGPQYEAAFADTTALRAAIDQELVEFDAVLKDAREVAFFPPMTGG